jgi:hypothetical protein
MSRRPGRILEDVEIRLPGHRSAVGAQSSPVFSAHFEEIWAILRGELSEL